MKYCRKRHSNVRKCKFLIFVITLIPAKYSFKMFHGKIEVLRTITGELIFNKFSGDKFLFFVVKSYQNLIGRNLSKFNCKLKLKDVFLIDSSTNDI